MARFRLPVLLAALALGTSAVAAEVDVRTTADGGHIDVRATAIVPTDLQSAWRVLTDYERYSQFLPDVRVSRVKERTANSALVEQSGDARFLFMRQQMDVLLAITESPPYTVRSVALGGSFREFAGRYDLEPVAGGVRFTYSARLLPGDGLPVWLVGIGLRGTVERYFRGLATQMAKEADSGWIARGAGSLAPSN